MLINKYPKAYMAFNNKHIFNDLRKTMNNRILVLDGAMGTMIQNYKLTEYQYRGNKFKNNAIDQKGNNEILNLTQPELITQIHTTYLDAGADIIETNTFNANHISQKDYEMEQFVYDMNKQAAIAAKKATKINQQADSNKYVAGVLGPTNKTGSISPKVEDPGYREVTFEQLYNSYAEQAEGLLDGGVDLFLVETIFDSINAKAALQAMENTMADHNMRLPVMVSFTINDSGGRMLTGQSIKGFVDTISKFSLFSIGMNCAFGAQHLKPFIEELAAISPFYVSAHPNAGLPNELGEYDQTPENMAKEVEPYCKEGLVNIIGGCCGSKPEHIAEISKVAKIHNPHVIKEREHKTVVSGLDSLEVEKRSNSYISIGERTNVMGSKKFLRLIKEEKFEEALDIAKDQISSGAQMLNINMDEAMIDGKKAMVRFLRLLAAEPKINKHPLMIDSSDFEILETGLQNVTGKPVINSISLKEGSDDFLHKASIIKKYGAAVVVMAFDEKGQADTYERKKEICLRSYNLLTKEIHFPAEDIIFDPNVLTVGTGIEEHNNYAVDFIEATRWIKQNLPYAKVSAGISNVSFAFRGNPAIRDAMNSIFVSLCQEAGLDFAIVNPDKIMDTNAIPEELKKNIEDVLLNRKEDATEQLLQAGKQFSTNTKSHKDENSWDKLDPKERLIQSLIEGETRYLSQDLHHLRENYDYSLDIIEGPLMEGMGIVGNLFEKGEMFLPQVVKTARTMKQAVSILMPYVEKENKAQTSNEKGKILLATVKGDVHDIGKNIFSLVLSCNNYDIIDLGVMVDNNTIINAIKEHQPDIVGVSGLITPSLNHMKELAIKMEENNFHIPLILGGATTSEIHTAVKVAPYYSGLVLRGADASQSAHLINNLLGKKAKQKQKEMEEHQKEIREKYEMKNAQYTYKPLETARKKSFQVDFNTYRPAKPNKLSQTKTIRYELENIEPFIDWKMFFYSWGLKGKFPEILEEDTKKGKEARRLYSEAKEMLKDIIENQKIEARAIFGIYPAARRNDDIIIYTDESRKHIQAYLPMLRQQTDRANKEHFLSLSDFIAPENSGVQDYIGTFAASAGFGGDKYVNEFKKDGDSYSSIMFRLLADRLTEAISEILHKDVRNNYWGYSNEDKTDRKTLLKQRYDGIRPSPGYPACPDHSLKKEIFNLMDVENQIGIQLTDSYAMHPASSVCGFYFALPESRYFNLGKISKDQINDYASRQRIPTKKAEELFRPYLNYSTK